jgi:hypothetical protein
MSSEQWEVLMVALILGAVHVFAPRAHALRRHPEQADAFGGGLSAAYVFLHLIPSLDTAHEALGERIYFITLLGFVAFYGIDLYFQAPRDAHPAKYHIYLAAFFVYDMLLVFTLGLNLPPTALLTLVFTLSLALDALNTDFELADAFGPRFARSGRWVLLIAVACGYGLHLFKRPNPMVVDILTAALTGFMIYHAFVGLFPVSRTKSFRSFVAGLVVFLAMHLLLGGID